MSRAPRQQQLERLGRVIDAHNAQLAQRSIDLATVRRRLQATRPSRTRQRIGLGLLLAACAALIAAWVVPSMRDGTEPRLSFIDDQGKQGHVGQWIESHPDLDRTLLFSDASTIELDGKTTARVERLDRHGARIAVRRGTANVTITARRHADWQIQAGPFRVHVVGTAFRVQWNERAETFGLAMSKGRVVVSGPLVGRRPLVAGEQLHVQLKQRRVDHVRAGQARPAATRTDAASHTNAVKQAPVDRPQEDMAQSPAHRVRRDCSTAPRRGALTIEPPARHPHLPDQNADFPWVLAERGLLDQALAAADKMGWDRVQTVADAAQLLSLADAARLERRAPLAARLYRDVRAGFPGTNQAAVAAFSLGLLAGDQPGSHGPARWLELYLQERPSGPLRAAAIGRLLEIRVQTQDWVAARELARRYLACCEKDAHAPLARRVLQGSEAGAAVRFGKNPSTGGGEHEKQ